MNNSDALQANRAHTSPLYNSNRKSSSAVSVSRWRGGCTELYTGCTTKRRLRAICLAGVRATVKPINAITRGGQIGIDGEHRSFRIIPALSVIKRESRPAILQQRISPSAVLFVSVSTTRARHTFHIYIAGCDSFFFSSLFRFRHVFVPPKKIPSMLNPRWRGPWQRITDWMECFYAVRISQARARLPVIKWKMNGRGKPWPLYYFTSHNERDPLSSGFLPLLTIVRARIKYNDFLSGDFVAQIHEMCCAKSWEQGKTRGNFV